MAGAANGNPPGPQQPPRPPMQSQHSSSVPSTPYQQARDLRFHSRSPSPRRALDNQSPRSAISEAVGPLGAQRSAPVVCKFETGAEIRKRRIPYVEGGNEELGPPKKEPKKALEPNDHEKLSGDMRELYDRLLPSQESEERRARLVSKLQTILNQEWPGNDIQVHVFGSSGNYLSSSDSDVDICITTTFKKLESMHAIAMLLDKHGMQKVVCRASAKVPIVKCWDPELKLAADLNVNNTLALENTRMIKTYVQLDERVRPLAKIIKHWTNRRILNDAAFGGTISSYTWICMIINFLQTRDPPILPSLQKLADGKPSENGRPSTVFADDLDKLKGSGDANKETLAELLFCFFRHYGYEFEYSKYVVSIREGRLLSRKEKGWDASNYQDKEARNRLCVEEPFTVIRNLGNSADDYAWSGIHGEIRRAFELLADGGQLEKCCEQYVFPPEEKPIFQKPVPKPKPTLTRSASQSGRPNHEQGSGRSRKGGNRNQSSQRSNNRRASSGATFSNQRVPFPFQSPPGGPMGDYFSRDLHNQLYQQYQFLQAQQDALQRQLQQSAQAQAQSQGRSSETSGSPLSRAYSGGLPSPRFMEHPPQTAPLLPGYLYHYPARYPPPSPMSQARSREGSSTNPSSPSMSTAVPSLRRQAHRGSVQDGPAGSIRSQSQPGRSLPHPLTAQQHAHPGYDVSGALGAQYPNGRAPPQSFPHGPLGIQMPLSPTSMGYSSTQPVDSALPKEYIGYYVGQSPSLGPQYAPGHAQLPTMMLRDPPLQRPRRVTPDLGLPLTNGQHHSRSPSPLSSAWSRSAVVEDWRNAQSQILQSPQPYETPTISAPTSALSDIGGPLIVDGSNKGLSHQTPERTNGIYEPTSVPRDEGSIGPTTNGMSRVKSLPVRLPLDPVFPFQQTRPNLQTPTSPQIAPGTRLPSGSKVNFAPNGSSQNGIQTPEQYHSDPTNGPLLSPVAELRTPSPTRSNAIERDSPRANGLVKTAKPVHAKQADPPPPSPTTKHERKVSAPNPTMPVNASAPATSPALANPPPITDVTNTVLNQNPWQQVSKKGHRKSKSSGTKGGIGLGLGQPPPANEAERKGG